MPPLVAEVVLPPMSHIEVSKLQNSLQARVPEPPGKRSAQVRPKVEITLLSFSTRWRDRRPWCFLVFSLRPSVKDEFLVALLIRKNWDE